MAKEKTLDAAANKRMMFSYLGMLGAAAYFVEPKEKLRRSQMTWQIWVMM